MHSSERTEILRGGAIKTPAFVIDAAALTEDAELARNLICDSETHLLFAMKSFTVDRGLRQLAEKVDGFAASSLFEVQLARRILQPGQTIHVTTPGLRDDEIASILELTDYLSFNSIPQWLRYRKLATNRVNCGLRINPQLSFVSDARYDPSRRSSKLGVPLDELQSLLDTAPQQLDGIKGIHFHNNCDSDDLSPLLSTVDRLLDTIDPLLEKIEWVNMGGGYLFNNAVNSEAVTLAKSRLHTRRPYRLFMEPGAALVRRAGSFVASVVDLFRSDGQQIAVLDTSVNHMPEVFEYQFAPEVEGDAESNAYSYLLSGSTCLAGDLFGEYAFQKPLEIGSLVIFPDMGAYSMVKANMFNGINLPTIYLLKDNGELELIKRFEFEDFQALCAS